MGKQFWSVIALSVLILLGMSCREAMTQEEAKAFYKGATVRFIVPFGPGGTYDLWARELAPHMEKHTGSKIIVENMPGAGGLVGGAYMYSLAKPDGLTLALFAMPGMSLGEMLEFEAVKYSLNRFAYIGRVEVMDQALLVSKTSGFKSIADMQKTAKTIRFGTSDPTAQSSVYAALIAEAFGLKAKIIPGYKGGKDYMLALISGRELDGVVITIVGYEDDVKRGDITLIGVKGKKRHPAFPEVPSLLEAPGIKPEGKKLLELLSLIDEGGRVVVAPPGLPEGKRIFLEKALSASLKEPTLLDWVKKNGYNINPLTGNDCKQLIANLEKILPKEERAKFKHLTTQKYF